MTENSRPAENKMLLSYVVRCFTGPQLYKRYKTPGEPAREYSPNFFEAKADAVLWTASAIKTISIYLSPIILSTLYRRGYFTQEYAIKFSIFLLIIYGGSYLFRGFGRMANPDYLTFLTILDECHKVPIHAANRRFLREFDFEFWAWPEDYTWKDTVHGEPVKPRKQLQLNYDFERPQSPILSYLQNITCWAVAGTVGRRLLYPGSLGLLNHMLQGALLDGRSKLVEEQGGNRFKLITKRGKSVDTLFLDRRNQQENGSTLVICNEGNAGYYEIGATKIPSEKGGGEAWPVQDTEAVDVAVQFAISQLGFQESDIVLFAWSIGGFTATWAAMNYPHIKGMLLDATFDDVLPLAKRAMPKSVSSIVHQAMREHLDLPIARQAVLYQGPIKLIRRTRDEVISTDDSSPQKQLNSNRGVSLLKEILKFRYPNLWSDKVVEKLDEWIGAQTESDRMAIIVDLDINEESCCEILMKAVNQQMSMTSPDLNVTLFPLEIGQNMSDIDKMRLIVFLANRYMIDFDSDHCTPLPTSMFYVPKHPWDDLID